MTGPIDRSKDPDTPRLVTEPGAIDEATVSDVAVDEESAAPALDPMSDDVTHQRRS